jgi:hypothetical protein
LPEQPDGGEHLEADEPARATGFGGEQSGDLRRVAFDDVSGAQEQELLLAAAGGALLMPRVTGAPISTVHEAGNLKMMITSSHAVSGRR